MLHDDDHRALGHRLGLFHFQEEAAGSVFWHPRGLQLLRALEDHLRRIVLRQGYREVRSPQVLAQPVWERSGHWSVFREGMLVVEGEARALKPVSCPGHMELVRRLGPLWSELPLRIAEFGLVHRDEPSGALHGLFRLRQFSQDDGHVFCREEQVPDELLRFVGSLRALYAALGFEDARGRLLGPSIESPRRRRRLGPGGGAARRRGARRRPRLEPPARERARSTGRSWSSRSATAWDAPGSAGRCRWTWSCPRGSSSASPMAPAAGTVRWSSTGRWWGALERFLGILLEHHRGRLPAWLAPEQVVVASVEGGGAHARNALRALEEAGVRARLDDRDAALSRKVADAHRLAVPYLVAAGPRDEAKGSVRLREASGLQRDLPLGSLGAELSRLCAAPAPG